MPLHYIIQGFLFFWSLCVPWVWILTIFPPDQRGTMACADVDMDIHGADEEPMRPGRRELIRHYQAVELMPDKKGPLHDLLQKQPAVLGVRVTKLFRIYKKINTC